MSRLLTAERLRGFTILELIVSIAIISLLLMILLPALGVARRAAHRTQCQNNLKQIGLALINYHETFNAYPPGYVSRRVSGEDGWQKESGPGYGWGVLLLDFVDQSPLATTMAFDMDATDPANTTAMSSPIPLWMCPAGQTPGAFDVRAGLSIFILASSNYVGMYGVGDLTGRPGQPSGAGIFYRNSDSRSWRVFDGLSATIFVGERAARHDFAPDDGSIAANSTWFAAIPGVMRPAGVADHPLMSVGPASLVLGAAGLDDPEFALLRPNHTNHIASFSSGHAGGLYVMMGDGAVRFLSDLVDRETFLHLAQQRDGQPVGEF